MKTFLITISVILALITSVSAQREEKPIYEPDTQLNECLRSCNYTTNEVLSCYDQAHADWLQEMNRIYNNLFQKVSEKTREKLIDAQIAWMAYKKEEGDFNQKLYTDMDGSMYQIMAASRKYQMLRQRAIELDTYYSDLTFDDSYPSKQIYSYVFNKNMDKEAVENKVKQIRFFYTNCSEGLKDVIRVNDENKVVPGSGTYNEQTTFTYNSMSNSSYAKKIEKNVTVAAHKEHSEWLFYNFGPDEEENCTVIPGEKEGQLIFYYYTDHIRSLRMYFHLNQVIKIVEDAENGKHMEYYPPFESMDLPLQKTNWPSFTKGKNAINFIY